MLQGLHALKTARDTAQLTGRFCKLLPRGPIGHGVDWAMGDPERLQWCPNIWPCRVHSGLLMLHRSRAYVCVHSCMNACM